MEVSLDRIKNDIETLKTFNSTEGNGCTRFSYSTEDTAAKEYLSNSMKQLGMEVKVDGAGNLRGVLQGEQNNLPMILIGSHLDTVKHGGAFDGIAGVVSALEVIRVLKENHTKTKHAVMLIAFAEEEGSNFGITTIGSKAATGKIGISEFNTIKNFHGKSLYEVLKESGHIPEKIQEDILKPSDIKAMLELHIEQSIVLDKNNLSIGIVNGIAGTRTYSLEFTGESNHAGSTPMNMRRDAMAAASKVISALNSIVKQKGLSTTVATAGKIECYPNVSNIIPGKVIFTVDIRDVDDTAMDSVLKEVIGLCEKAALENGVKFTAKPLAVLKGTMLSKHIINEIENVVKEKGFSYCNMLSGAVHDSAVIADIAHAGMIFVPSRDGKSHVPDEYTSYEEIKTGCEVLLETLLRVDKNN